MKIMVVTAILESKFTKKMNAVFSDPQIEIVRTTYAISWGQHFAYIEYLERQPETVHKEEERNG
ncbi:MAG: hypothetical protein LBN36_06925 [Clostridiales Family XIII bacterium]|jgi:hypothetical protein|nr:hypothetical protein [Clostridiales Family XIII bacterium]